MSPNELKVRGRYNWRGQPERLVYLGFNWSGNGCWHQFTLVNEPNDVWCEVLDSDLPSFEETKEPAKPETATAPAPVATTQAQPSEDWRRLALRFDGQRMAAMAHLRLLLEHPAEHAEVVRKFLAASPTEQASQPPAPSQAPAGWRIACGDWRDELVAIHGPDGHIVSGLTMAQAGALIAAHGGSEAPAASKGARG